MPNSNEVSKQLCYLLDSSTLGISPFYTFLESDSFAEVKDKMKQLTCFVLSEKEAIKLDEEMLIDSLVSVFESSLEFAKIRYACLEDKFPLYIHKFMSSTKQVYYAFVYPYAIKHKNLISDLDYFVLKLKNDNIVCSDEHFVNDVKHVYEDQIVKYIDSVFKSV